MNNFKKKFGLTNFDLSVYIFILGMIIYSLVCLVFAKDLLAQLVVEDGLVENLTALMLFASSFVCIYRIKQYASSKKYGWLVTQIVLAILFFFAAGEELSWGQRIFDVQTGEFFQQYNLQGETNLHNLKVGDTKINSLVFSQMLFIVLVIYFVFLEYLARNIKWMGNLVQFFNVPLPKLHHIIMMLVTALIIQIIYYSRHEEMLEFVFASIFLLIFISPKIIVLEE